MADPFLAEIRIFPFNFAPKGWAFCDGQILAISQNTALFSLLGTTYGGNGQSNFALPNLQDTAPMHAGQGPGLQRYDLGETGGSETVTLQVPEMPGHSHALPASGRDASSRLPAGQNLAAGVGGVAAYAPPGALVPMSTSASAPTGGNQPHNNMQPYVTLNFCIALQGIFPARS